MSNETALLILIMPNGERAHHALSKDGKGSWISRQMHDVGGRYPIDAKFAASVLIIGTEVQQYNGNETREVLGLP